MSLAKIVPALALCLFISACSDKSSKKESSTKSADPAASESAGTAGSAEKNKSAEAEKAATEEKTLFFETIYGRKADVSALRKVLTITDLKEVVAEMEKTGVRIFKVPYVKPEVDKFGASANKKEKPAVISFDFLPEVPTEFRESLAEDIKQVDGEGAMFVTWNEINSNPAINVLLVSEASKPTTLFHEFSHHLFEISNRKDTERISKEQRDNEEFLRIYNKRVGAALLDDYSLVKRSWRENFDEYVSDYSKTFDAVQGQLNSEEVAIETGLLKLMLELKSPHFSYDRAYEGVLLYCQKSIIEGALVRLKGTVAFMDRIRTSAKQPDSDWTQEELDKREVFYAPIYERMTSYENLRIRPMQAKVDEAKVVLDDLAKKAKDAEKEN